jgi:UPF0042 nucleotide-binding protein
VFRAPESRRRCARWRTSASTPSTTCRCRWCPQLIELLASRPDIDRTALGIDARSGNFLEGMATIFADLRTRGHSVEVLFLEASDEILIRRFSETRRRHPLSDTDIRAGITAERQTLAALRQEASALVDTGALNVHVLRGLIQERYGAARASWR